jgi:pimeloyl-ACP methyl ester carboxylesterase
VPVTPSRPIRLEDSKLDGVPGRVLEARLVVPENPARPNGRVLTLTAVILAADSAEKRRDPILVFQGGPGQAATELAGFYARFFARVRAHRDIILMDQRGTGQSGALKATVIPERMLDDLGAVVPASWVAPTLEALRDTVDLTQYTTRRIVDDADRLIGALGYSRVNLYGTSYGTRCALDFMRRHRGHVRTAVIKNVLPMRAPIPLSYGANAQRALQLLFDDVAADSVARAEYPELRAKLDGLLRRLDAAPARVEVTNPATQQKQDVELTRGGVAMTIRMMLMSLPSRSRIPYLVDRAAADSLGELATQMVQLRMAYAKTLALGMSISVVAAEDCPRLTPALVERDTSGSFLRDAALVSFRNACESWPHARVEPEFFQPVRSTAPTLVVSGGLDPATPPAWGKEVARALPNSAHVVFRYAAHPNAGFTGLEDLVASFIEAGSVRGLDLSCAEAGAPLPFEPRSR